MKDPILLSTICALSVPLTYAAYSQYWDIYGSLLVQLMAGIAFHSSKDVLLMKIDQLCILQFMVVSFHTAYELELLYLAITGISWASYVYVYGYYTNSLGFSNSYIESTLYHGSIHIMASGMWCYGIYVKQCEDRV